MAGPRLCYMLMREGQIYSFSISPAFTIGALTWNSCCDETAAAIRQIHAECCESPVSICCSASLYFAAQLCSPLYQLLHSGFR